MEIQAPELPENHAEFARAVADLADKFGMNAFEMTYKPHWHQEPKLPSNISGDVKITYRNTDGRGRPERYLNIEFEVHLSKRVGPKIVI